MKKIHENKIKDETRREEIKEYEAKTELRRQNTKQQKRLAVEKQTNTQQRRNCEQRKRRPQGNITTQIKTKNTLAVKQLYRKETTTKKDDQENQKDVDGVSRDALNFLDNQMYPIHLILNL